MTLRSATKTLLVLTLGLPVVQMVLLWVGGLLTGMGDPAGAAIIHHLGTGCQLVWALSLVGLVITLSFVVLNDHAGEEQEP